MQKVTCFEILPLKDSDYIRASACEKLSLESEGWTEEGIRSAIGNNGRYFGAYFNGKYAGHAGFTAVLDEYYITNTAVLPEFRKMGAATALFRKIEDFAAKNGASFISLEVRETNTAAVSLYEKLGYKICGKRNNFYKNPSCDALIMTHDLKKNERQKL